MTKAQLKQKVLAYGEWEFWAERPFYAFIISLFKQGNTRAYMKKATVNAEWPAMIYERGGFYKNQKVWDDFAKQLERHLKSGHTFFEVSASMEKFYKVQKSRVIKLAQTQGDPIKRLVQLHDILAVIISYVWLTHGFEHYYIKKLRQEIPKYIAGDVEKFIGDISFPKKKNAHTLMEEALRRGGDIKKITEQFAWIKVRDGFSSGFTVAEMKREQAKLKKSTAPHWQRPKVPKQLNNLVKVAQELVYFRTYRTDVFYEFMWLARPLLRDVATYYGLKFEDLRNYAVQDLVSGKLKEYPQLVNAVSYGKEFVFFDRPILPEQNLKLKQAQGIIAFMGKVKGRAKIVKVAHEVSKVKKGDILVAPTTFPSFIMGMKLAAAFVTDEGGMTSHAAIVAREMKKPCIIGTKFATKIFKDGDMVEVDADKGVVKLL